MATEIGIDLGTSKTVIFSGSKIILELPSVVTVDAETYKPIYFGEKAKATIGRVSDVYECVYPIKNGMIADYDVSEAMIKEYMKTAFGNKIVRPQVVATLPTGLSELQHHSLYNVLESGGCRNITVIESPLATAIGLDIDISLPKGNMIVDIGAGTTDIAVVSLGRIVESDCFEVASSDFDSAIVDYVRKHFNVAIGLLTAEVIKKEIGTVVKKPIEITAIAKGRSLISGLPDTFEITSNEIYTAIKPAFTKICNAVKKVLERTEPDLLADISENGIYLCGGGSQISGMAELLEDSLGVKINSVDDPSHSVARGAAASLKKPQLIRSFNYQLHSIEKLEIK